MKKRYIGTITLVALIGIGYMVPEAVQIPVEGATPSDWNKKSFWYEPWGTSGVHKGIDIFGKKGTSIVATTHMIILYQGEIKKGGKIILALGPKWRLHYFAHLHTIEDNLSWFVTKGETIGTLGDSGNAKGKQPHLHYSILSVIPRPWHIDNSTQGYKKAFYLNPIPYLSRTE